MTRASSTVLGTLGFSEPMTTRPKFHANDTSIDVMNVVPRSVLIEDARHRAAPAALDTEGFRLYPHKSAVRDFRNRSEVEQVHVEEIRRLLLAVSGADQVVVTGAGVLRFGERSAESGAHNNSRPARFVHVDCSDATATSFYERSRPDTGRRVRRSAQYNVWRAITPPPQDVPLAVCDARTVRPEDFIPADAIFDRDGAVAFSFEALLLRYSPRQRWVFYSNMGPDEALVFKTNDTDRSCAHCVAHGAFDNTDCPAGVVPRASLEMRGIAYWFEGEPAHRRS
jgi:hypothetical protein